LQRKLEADLTKKQEISRKRYPR